MHYGTILVALICLAHTYVPLLSVTMQCASISEVQQYIETHKDRALMIVFDIDNTIATASHAIGSDPWFSHYIKQCIQSGMSAERALEVTVPLYLFIQQLIDLVPVESETIELIKTLQRNNIKVIALTARSCPLIERTVEQLAKINIDFSPANRFASEDIIVGLDSAWAYSDGIIFCSNYTKGVVLLEFLNTLEDADIPDTIIFIDDKEHHVCSVDTLLTKAGITSLCIHYTFMDEAVKKFDPAVAHEQLASLLKQYRI